MYQVMKRIQKQQMMNSQNNKNNNSNNSPRGNKDISAEFKIID